MEKVASKEIGTGNFIIGNTKLLPTVEATQATPASFKQNQSLNFWMQVYNLGIDDTSKKNSAVIHYQIIDLATNKPIFQKDEDTKLLGATSDQLTLSKSVPLASVPPGKYQVKVSIDDSVSKQQIAQTVPFNVE
jgi:hypothetical protein